MLKILQSKLSHLNLDTALLVKPFAVYWHESKNVSKYITLKEVQFEKKIDPYFSKIWIDPDGKIQKHGGVEWTNQCV